MINIPDFKDILRAEKNIKNKAHKTPVLTCNSINQILDTEIYFKCENFQKVGAFKFRGATNALQNLMKIEKPIAVCTHSSGNHAQALSLAAKQAGISAYIVMPNNAPKVKIDAVKSYHAQIIFCDPTLNARESSLEMVQKETKAVFIHPYDNCHVIAGQGTAALEFVTDYPDLDVLMTPVGGGGLLSGSAISAKHLTHSIKVFGAEPLNANDAWQSFYQKQLVPSLNPNTIADGLLTSLSERTFKIISKYVDDIFTCKEESIIAAMRLVFERMKIVIEPSSAVPLAVVLENPEKFKRQRIGIILSGGNVDLLRLPFK
jgi:threonine dehydratase